MSDHEPTQLNATSMPAELAEAVERLDAYRQRIVAFGWQLLTDAERERCAAELVRAHTAWARKRRCRQITRSLYRGVRRFERWTA